MKIAQQWWRTLRPCFTLQQQGRFDYYQSECPKAVAVISILMMWRKLQNELISALIFLGSVSQTKQMRNAEGSVVKCRVFRWQRPPEVHFATVGNFNKNSSDDDSKQIGILCVHLITTPSCLSGEKMNEKLFEHCC